MDMSTLTHKTTILLSPEEHRLLVQLAKDEGATLGEMIRRAIRKVYRRAHQGRHQQRWERLFSAKAPVSDWESMEADITRGRLET